MPSIQDALQQALSRAAAQPVKPVEAIPKDWDDELEQASIIETSTTKKERPMRDHLFAESNGISRLTFEYIRDNPMRTRKQVIEAMDRKGFAVPSVTALLSKYVQCGVVSEDENKHLRTVAPEYVPIGRIERQLRKSRANQKQAKAAKQAAATPPVERKARDKTPKEVEEVVRPRASLPSAELAPWSVQRVLEGLSVLQAQALYAELRKIFGSK